MTPWRASFSAQAETGSLPGLRQRVQHYLRRQGVVGDLVDRAGLLISELTHNAVAEAGGGAVRVTVAETERGLRLEVECEENRDLERLQRALGNAQELPDSDSERGRGLWLVLAFSRDLEVLRDPNGHVRVTLLVAGKEPA